MAAAPASSRSAASVSRRVRNFLSSSSRRSASRERSSRSRFDPVLSSVTFVGCCCSCVATGAYSGALVSIDGADFCFVGCGFSPNPLPADSVTHDCCDCDFITY